MFYPSRIAFTNIRSAPTQAMALLGVLSRRTTLREDKHIFGGAEKGMDGIGAMLMEKEMKERLMTADMVRASCVKGRMKSFHFRRPPQHL